MAPTGDKLGEVLAGSITDWQRRRVERANELVLEAASLANATGRDPRSVPGRVLMPILESASVEESAELQHLWACLLANASLEPDDIPPAFPAILAELSPSDARILDWMYRKGGEDIETTDIAGLLSGLTTTIAVTMQNLGRLGLCVPARGEEPRGLAWYSNHYNAIVPEDFVFAPWSYASLTELGIAFIQACQPPK